MDENKTNSKVVDTLEKILEEARAGRINSLGAIFTRDDTHTGVVFCGNNVTGDQILGLLQGNHTIQGYLVDAISGKTDFASQEPSDQSPESAPEA